MQDYTLLKKAMDALRVLFVKKLIDINEIKNSRQFLREIAVKNPNNYTYNEAFRLYNIIKPYSIKLKQVNFNFDDVPPIKIKIQEPKKVEYKDKIIGYNGTSFVVRFPYNKIYYEAIKEIKGAKYEYDKKTWHIPITSSNELKQFAMGFNFEVGDMAFRMMNNVTENLEQSYSAEYIELNLPVKKDFYPFQTVGIDYVRKNQKVIIGDQMGLGKTVQAIGGILITNKFPCLIICPKSLRRNWQDEWHAWTNKKAIILDSKNIGNLKQLIDNNLIDVVITNYDGVQTHFVETIKEIQITEGEKAGTSYDKVYTNGLEKLFTSIVLDEAHNCRNKKTLRFKSVKKCFDDKQIRICLTGTPVVKSPQDLGSLLELIGRIDDFGGHYKFVKQYGELGKNFLEQKNKSQSNLTAKEAKTAQILRELNVKLRSLCFIRREKHQVLKELPEKFRKIIRTPLENQKDYDHAYISLQSFMDANGATNEQISNALKAELLVRINVLKKISAIGKLNAVKEFAEDVINGGEKLIIVCWFNDTVQFLKDNLKKYNPVTISGKIDGRDTKDEEIQIAKQKFQKDDECKLIIITYGKGGEGHTLTAASKVAMIELGWTYKDQAQAEDRAHRIGQVNNVECYYFLGENTIDEEIYNIIDSRRRLEQETTGGNENIATTFSILTYKLAKNTA